MLLQTFSIKLELSYSSFVLNSTLICIMLHKFCMKVFVQQAASLWFWPAHWKSVLATLPPPPTPNSSLQYKTLKCFKNYFGTFVQNIRCLRWRKCSQSHFNSFLNHFGRTRILRNLLFKVDHSMVHGFCFVIILFLCCFGLIGLVCCCIFFELFYSMDWERQTM